MKPPCTHPGCKRRQYVRCGTDGCGAVVCSLHAATVDRRTLRGLKVTSFICPGCLDRRKREDKGHA